MEGVFVRNEASYKTFQRQLQALKCFIFLKKSRHFHCVVNLVF